MESLLKKHQFPNQPGKTGYSALDLYQALGGAPTQYSRWFNRSVRNAPTLEGKDWVSLDRRSSGEIRGKFAQDYLLSEDLAYRIALKHPGPAGDEARRFFSAAYAASQALPATGMEALVGSIQALVLTVQGMLSVQDRRLAALEEKSAPNQLLLPPPAPEQSFRSQVVEIVESWGHRNGGRYSDGYNRLYTKFERVFGMDLKRRSKNLGKKTLDYAEAEGHMPKLLSLAKTHLEADKGERKQA